jgi:hypothetical protein
LNKGINNVNQLTSFSSRHLANNSKHGVKKNG